MAIQSFLGTKEIKVFDHIIFSGDFNESEPNIGQIKKETVKFLEDHLEIQAIIKESLPALADCFGTPLKVVLEIFPDDGNPKMIGWIQSADNIKEGMEKFDQFENWYISKNFDLLTDNFNFSIEFVEAE
ncbi:hypothetical protein QUF72_01060 [Desulfobacterales bacterium HSG2]|nr:hypothetical protein [Desulfobacterales bacterium HSG2]